MYVCMQVCFCVTLSVCIGPIGMHLSVHVYKYLSVCVSASIFLCSFVCLSVRPSVYMDACMFVYVCTYASLSLADLSLSFLPSLSLSVSLSQYIYIYVCVCVCVRVCTCICVTAFVEMRRNERNANAFSLACTSSAMLLSPLS